MEEQLADDIARIQRACLALSGCQGRARVGFVLWYGVECSLEGLGKSFTMEELGSHRQEGVWWN